jgi:RND family efflux transporter MFP subunit
MTPQSRSRLAVFVVAAVVLALVVAGALVYSRRSRVDTDAAPAAAGMPMGGAAPQSAAEPPRGDVGIDARRQQLLGVRIGPVERVMSAATVRTTGVVRYDETRQTDVNVKVDGWIRDLDVDFTGQPVRRGQRLFTLYSPELLATQNEFIQALRNRDQAQASPLLDTRDYANRLVEAARQRLALWDLPADEIRAIETSREPIQALAFTAPAAGIVTEKQAVKGMHVTAGQTLYKIGDLSVVWIDADIYEQDMSAVRIGQAATVSLGAYPGQPNLTARATYVYPTVDPQTRTGKVRFQLGNPGGRLKPGMFVTVELRGTESSQLVVPANAVVDTGLQQTVFVAEGEGRFAPRPVKAGRRVGDNVEILEGVKEGEQVAASATFFLDSESQLRAGLQNYEAPPAAQSASAPAQSLDIAFRPLTDPPKTGDNIFEVSVKDQAGQPIAGADVSVQLFMPAMPTMNMPAMRNEVRLPSVGGGVYRGPGQVMMAGRWDATVTVSKGGQRLGSRQFALAAN